MAAPIESTGVTKQETDADPNVPSEEGPTRLQANDRFQVRLDTATVDYFAEIQTHLKGFADDEERQLLVGNALEETKGRELQVSTDAACSRVLESLLKLVDPASLVKFATAFLAEDQFFMLCTK